MDTFMNLAKKGLDAYTDSQKSDSQPDVSKTGGAEFNSPNNQPPQGGSGGYNYGSGNYGQGGSGGYGGSYGAPSFNDDEVVKTANQHGSGESSLFSSALSFLNNNKEDQTKPLDEDDVQKAHKKAYEENSPGGLSANLLGSAAAMQVLKQFTGGSSSDKSAPKDDAGGMTKLISLAMAEATKLFDKSGGAASGDKQDAVNGAAMTVMKLMVQSKMGGSTTGGSDSGGLGQLMSLASKFAK
ncbi:hypothetical protein ONZ45_g6532 [Pleurotus djamor]|nr:hypothetical protein ONZ45_g6532 [Pleurotus djamor]